jgi:polyether ionophore transport system permease protein
VTGSVIQSSPVDSNPARSSPVRSRTLALAGTRELTRFALRRDRMMLPAWIYVLVIVAASGGYGLKLVYKTPHSRASLVASVYHDKALAFLYGQLHGSSLGAIGAWRYLMYATLAAGLMNIFLVIRHTRADEEAGRLELVGSTAVGRHAPLASAMLVASTASLAAIVLTSVVLMASGLPAVGSVAFAVAEASGGLVFGALAALAAQISGTARGARGLVITTLAVCFLLRGVGDSGGGHGLSWLTWLSPLGWAEQVQPFTADRWWVLTLPAAAIAFGVAVATGLAAYRDQGAGLVQPRPGPRVAGRLLSSPEGLAWRLQRGTLAGWAAGFLVGGLAIGVVANGIGPLIGSSAGVDKALDRIAGQSALTSAYLAACMSLLGLVAAAYAISAVLRLRAEETDGTGEPVLAEPVGRLRWAGSHLLIAALGTGAVLLAGGLGTALGYGIASSTTRTQLPRLIEAALAQWPAALAVAAVAAVFVGLLPQWSTAAGWTAFALCGLIGLFGPAFRLTQAVLDVSPFTHVPKLPGGSFSAVPLLWLSAFCLVVTAAGLAGLRHRDIG